MRWVKECKDVHPRGSMNVNQKLARHLNVEGKSSNFGTKKETR